MPHVISDTTTKEWIAITMQNKDNINQAPRLLNLCPAFPPLAKTVDDVYEVYDESTPQKKNSPTSGSATIKQMGLPSSWSEIAIILIFCSSVKNPVPKGRQCHFQKLMVEQVS